MPGKSGDRESAMIPSLETEIVQPPFSPLFRQSGTRVLGRFPKSPEWALNLQDRFSDGVSTRDVSGCIVRILFTRRIFSMRSRTTYATVLYR
jgi:hypothetical protein